MAQSKPGFRQKPQPTKAQQQQKGYAERITALEEGYQGLVGGVNNLMAQQAKRILLLEEAMGAVVQLVGVDEVQNLLAEKKKRMEEERDASLKALVQKALDDKEIEVAETIDDDSLVIGTEKDAEGNVMASRAQIAFADVAADFKPRLLGKGVGTVISTSPQLPEDGKEEGPHGTFEVLEIYKIVKKPEAAEGDPTAQGATHADQVAAAEAQ